MIQANLLLSRPFIKINACLIGYGLWMILSQHQIITNTIHAPLCFYKIPKETIIVAPDTIELIIAAPRKDFHALNASQTAIHLDASTLNLGTNHIVLQKENLFLPDTINLINLIPSSLQIQLLKPE